VQIDGKVFNLNATVKKQYGVKDGNTFTLFLRENRNKKASPAVTSQNSGSFKGAGNAPMNNIASSPHNNNAPF